MKTQFTFRETLPMYAISAVLVLLVGAWFNWPVIRSGFDVVYGDHGDNRLSMMLMEHWYLAFLGKVEFLNPLFFSPAKGVIGFTDSYFLLSLPYAAGRMLGLTEYGAFQAVVISASIVSFISMYWLLRKVIVVDAFVALMVSLIYAFPNVLAVNMGHVQFVMISVLPLVTGFMIRFLLAVAKNHESAWKYGYGFVIAVPLMMVTSVYVGWFYVLFLLILIGLLFAQQIGKSEWTLFPRIFQSIKIHRKNFFLLFSAALFASLPLIFIYGRLFVSRGGFAADALFVSTMPHPLDLLNAGAGNTIWGHLLTRLIPDIHTRLSAYELNAGFPFVFSLILVVGVLFAGKAFVTQSQIFQENRFQVSLAAFLGLGLLLSLASIVRVGDDWSLWWLIRKVVPGAGGIRVVSRFQLILLFPACVVVAISMSLLLEHLRKRVQKTGFGRSFEAAVFVLMAFLLVEQSNEVYARFSKGQELARFAAVKAPPHFCKVFAIDRVTGASLKQAYGSEVMSDAAWRRIQVDAIKIAYQYGIPTVNGLSSNTPSEYWLVSPSDPMYFASLGEWLVRQGLTSNVCLFNIGDNAWRAVSPILKAAPVSQNLLKPKAGEDLSSMMYMGLEGFAGVGFGDNAWTSGHSVITLISPPSAKAAVLTFYVINPEGTHLRVKVGSQDLGEVAYKEGMHTIRLPLSDSISSITLDATTFVPHQLNKKSSDNRRLGVLLTEIQLAD